MPSKSNVPPKADAIGVSSKLREANPWFDTQSESLRTSEVTARRKSLRNKGPQLSEKDLIELIDELDQIQAFINPKLERRDLLLTKLLPHWGHTGASEYEGSTGKTLISTSFQMGVHEAPIKAIGDSYWRRVSKRELQADLLLCETGDSPSIRDTIKGATVIKKLVIQVKPPSSRTEKAAGLVEDEE